MNDLKPALRTGIKSLASGIRNAFQTSNTLRSTPCRARVSFVMQRPCAIMRNLLRSRVFWFGLAMSVLCGLLSAAQARAQSSGMVIPRLEVGVGTAKSPKDVAVTLQILFMMTILTL